MRSFQKSVLGVRHPCAGRSLAPSAQRNRRIGYRPERGLAAAPPPGTPASTDRGGRTRLNYSPSGRWALYSSHSSVRVTLMRMSSACTLAKSGGEYDGIARGADTAGFRARLHPALQAMASGDAQLPLASTTRSRPSVNTRYFGQFADSSIPPQTATVKSLGSGAWTKPLLRHRSPPFAQRSRQ